MQNNTPPIQILIAEDLETDAFFIEQAFGQSKVENKTHRVKDGAGIISFLKKQDDYADAPRPHIIIMDMKMQGKDGLKALKEVKKSKDFRDIPVIVFSASNESGDIANAYAAYANAYIPKSNGFENMQTFVSAIEDFWFLRARLPQNDA